MNHLKIWGCIKCSSCCLASFPNYSPSIPKNKQCHIQVLHTLPHASLNLQLHPLRHFFFELNFVVWSKHVSGTKLFTILLPLGFCLIRDPHHLHVKTHSHTKVLQTMPLPHLQIPATASYLLVPAVCTVLPLPNRTSEDLSSYWDVSEA